MKAKEIVNKFRSGIVKGEWDVVREAFKDLTGEDLAPKEPGEELIEEILSSSDKNDLNHSMNMTTGSLPSRELKSHEYWDGSKIRRKKKDN